LLFFLIAFVFTLVTLFVFNGIRHFYRQLDSSKNVPNISELQHSSQTIAESNVSEPQLQDSSEIISKPNIPEIQRPTNLLQDSQLLGELENKLFVATEFSELKEKELQFLNLLLSLENSNLILLENEKLRILREISGDLINAYKFCKTIKGNPSSKDFKLFKSLSEKKVICFQGITKDWE
jgi:hypothetical protein